MQPPYSSHFEDPHLRRAVLHAFALEKAPPSLRRKIEWRSPLYALVAAAVIVLAVMIVARQLLGNAPSSPAPYAAKMPAAFAAKLVAAHDQCAHHPGHGDMSVPDNDINALSGKLEEKLGFPVFATNMSKDWTFSGASACNIGTTPAAHLLFKRDNESLSLFSIPSEALYSPRDRGHYELTFANHAINGFVHRKMIYLVVCMSSDSKNQEMPLLAAELARRAEKRATALKVLPLRDGSRRAGP